MDNRIQLLTRKEVQERLRISRTTLYRLVEAGKFPSPIRVGDRLCRWRESDIDAYVEHRIQADGQ